jgi:hypothetical protein
LRVQLTWYLLSASCCCRHYLPTVLRDESSHSLSPAGFVYLRFFWTLAPFLFSNVWPYQPVAIAVLVYLQFVWGSALPHSWVKLPHREVLLPLTPELRASYPLCYVSFFSVDCLLFRFFFQGGGQSFQGAMLIFLWGGCGRTMCHLLLTCGSARGLGVSAGPQWEPS